MNRVVIAAAAGLVFGLGLAISDMINPARVLGFLDLFGVWDPTLAFVMIGALIPMAIAWRIDAAQLPAPPSAGPIDARLVGGAALFGVGWGLVGFCPGPAIAALGPGAPESLLFLGAMAAGMALHDRALRAA